MLEVSGSSGNNYDAYSTTSTGMEEANWDDASLFSSHMQDEKPKNNLPSPFSLLASNAILDNGAGAIATEASGVFNGETVTVIDPTAGLAAALFSSRHMNV